MAKHIKCEACSGAGLMPCRYCDHGCAMCWGTAEELCDKCGGSGNAFVRKPEQSLFAVRKNEFIENLRGSW